MRAHGSLCIYMGLTPISNGAIEQITEIRSGNGQDFSFVGHFCAPNRVQGA